MNPPRRTRVKICGITTVADALLAAELGADAVGLVFAPASPRCLAPEAANEIASALPPFVARVGLFVDADPAFIQHVLATVGLDLLQFHGDESPAACRSQSRPFLKAARVRPGVDLLEFAARFNQAEGVVLDAFHPAVRGGTGQTFDWALIPPHLPLPVVLAGGLNPANVAAAIRAVRPWAIDVASGVEAAPGRKDAAKLATFFDEVRRADG